MKVIGYMVHYYEVDTSEKSRNQNNVFPFKSDLDQAASKPLRKISKLHAVYCIALCVYKILACPLFLLLTDHSQDFRKFITKEFIILPENVTIFRASDSFKTTLLNVGNGLFALQLFTIPLFYVIVSIFTNLYDQTGKTYETTEKVIQEYFEKYNQAIKNLSKGSKQELKYKTSYVLVWSIVYVTISVGFLILLSRFLPKIFVTIYNPHMSVYGNIFGMTFIIGISLYSFDLIITSYYFAKFIIISINQFNAFTSFFKNVVENFYSESLDMDFKELKLRIEDIRKLYYEICMYVFQIDSWISYMNAFVYFTSIPAICLFLYTIPYLKEAVEREKFSIIVSFFAFELFGIVMVGINLNTTVKIFSILYLFVS